MKIDPFGDILVGPHMKTHEYFERYSPRLGKQTITPRVAFSRRSTILFYLYEICIYFKLNTSISQDVRTLSVLRSSGVVNVPVNSHICSLRHHKV